MTCIACNIKRAQTLIQARIAMDEMNPRELEKELHYRWPHSFYFSIEEGTGNYTLMHKNPVPPHDPYHVYTFTGWTFDE